MPAQERFKKALDSPLAYLEAMHKQEVKVKAELPTALLSVERVPPHSTSSRNLRKSLIISFLIIELNRVVSGLI